MCGDSHGEVSEWLMVADSKSVLGLHLTEVRILSSPYTLNKFIEYFVVLGRNFRPGFFKCVSKW
jgi:hypothetical protein